MFKLDTYANVKSLIEDAEYAKSKGISVKKYQIKSPRLKELEDKLKTIPSDDNNWRENVDTLKRAINQEKCNLMRYVVKYNKQQLTADNYRTLGLFRSVITDGKKILCFAPPKSILYEQFENCSREEDREYQEFCEGTMINMYFDSYIGDWEIATRSNIGARCKFYNTSDLTFRKMFLDAFTKQQLLFDHFDTKYCYSFVLQHPKNRIVVPYTMPKIVLTNVYKCGDDVIQEIGLSSDVLPTLPRPALLKSCEYYNIANLQSLTEAYSESRVLDYTLQGAVVCDRKQGIRYKVRNPHYEYVRGLRGNNPKLQYQYYCLRSQGQVKNYLQYYPEEMETFTKFRDQLHKWTLALHRNYISCYIQKDKPLREYPFEYRSHMYKLHEHYRNSLRDQHLTITRRVVINYVNNLPPNHIMASINYPLKHVKGRAQQEKLLAVTM